MTAEKSDKNDKAASAMKKFKLAPDVYEQSKTTPAKAVLDVLRSGDPPLGTLTSEEQVWLATAFAHLNRVCR
jgi:hypothetical protein